MTFHLMRVHIFSSVWVAWSPPFGKKLVTRLTICFLCFFKLTICKFSYIPFWFCGLDLGSGCFLAYFVWSLHTFDF